MFKRKLSIALCLLGFISLQIIAQNKESSPDSIVELKVNQLQGIQFKIEVPYFVGFGPHATGTPLFFNYLNEIRIAPTSTILLKAGLSVTPGVFYEDSISYIISPNEKTGHKVPYCSFGYNFGVEPRWYWNYQKRALSGKAKLNSGWFLSLPLELSLLQAFMICGPTIYYNKNSKWISEHFSLLYSLGISTGYRHALSNHWFLEGSMELQASGDWNKYGQNIYKSPTGINPQLEMRASYIFGK